VIRDRSVTVVIPTLPSRAEFLAEAIASVQAQTRLPDAIVVVYDLDHEGAAATRSRGLDMVQTEYTAFLDDDDTLYPEHLARMDSSIWRFGADLVYPWFDGGEQGIVAPLHGQMLSPKGLRFTEESREYLLNVDNFIPITFCVRTDLAQSVGGFPVAQHHNQYAAEDWEFLRKIARTNARIVHHDAITWHWRIHDKRTKGWSV